MKMYRDRERVRNMVNSAGAEQHGHIRAIDFDGREDQLYRQINHKERTCGGGGEA